MENNIQKSFRKESRRFFSLSLISILSAIGMPYCEGRTNSVWEVVLFPADFIPPVVLFISTAMLFSYLIAEFGEKRPVLPIASMFLVSGLLFAAWFPLFSCNQDFYQLGLKDYAKRIITTDEWRTISRFAQANIQPGGHLWGPSKARQDDNEKKLWSAFTNHTQIQKLGPWVMISVPFAGGTKIEWGGALIGHRGIIIYSNTNNVPSSRNGRLGPAFLAPDIATFME